MTQQPMNRIINDPDEVAAEALAGIVSAHPDLIVTTPHARVFRTVAPVTDRVGIVTGGGSGHEPAFIGFVGPGLVDAVATGEVFASPTARAFEAAFRAADGGRGVACLYGNYAGDNMNVKMAVRLAARDGLTVKTVVANDDAASAPPGEADKRRGVAGEVLMWKTAAALAREGADLDAVIAVAQKSIRNTRSIGIGLSACTIPAAGKPNFTIAPGTMEVGIGHHGEPGIAVMPTASARAMAALMLDTILPDLPFGRGEDVAVLISGLGATPVMELYILYTHVAEILAAQGITIRHRFVGNYFTSLEMMGASVTLTRVDGELDRLIGAPARSIGLTVTGRHAMTDSVDLKAAGPILLDMVAAIVEHATILSELDGKTGDGDHGVNMSKGFRLTGQKLARAPQDLGMGFGTLAETLLDEIGGSMGPLYGSFFLDMSTFLAGRTTLDRDGFAAMLHQGMAAVIDLGGAKAGDKSLVDVLIPASQAYDAAAGGGEDFAACLTALEEGADSGFEATRDMVAKIGRASRLGERSRGHHDAGAASCRLLLVTLSKGLRGLL